LIVTRISLTQKIFTQILIFYFHHFQLVVLALAAVAFAEPEADPLHYYTNGQYVYKAHSAAPVVVNPAMYGAYANPAMYYNYYNPYVYATTVVAKQAEEVPAPEAEAEVPAPEAEVAAPEAKTVAVAPITVPQYAYTIPQMYYNTPVVAAPVAYKVPSYYAQSAPGVVHQVNKREAEADAGYGYYGYGAYPYANYGYAAARPFAYNYGYAAPYGYARYF
jgi:hypothetical protein